MDKRMRELVEQAFITVDGPETFKPSLRQPLIDGLEDLFQEFAELIVKECLGDFKNRIATRYQGSDKDRDIAYGMEIVYMDIVDKFGVEE